MRTPDQALAWCANAPLFDEGHCLAFVVAAYDLSGQTPEDDAADAYAAVHQAGHGAPPVGAIQWWTGGSPDSHTGKRHGHVAIATGDGGCYSTDFTDAGYVGDGRVHRLQSFTSIAMHDQLLTYGGWSYDLEGITVVKEEDMPLSEEDVQKVATAVVDQLIKRHQDDTTHPNTNASIREDTAAIRKKLGA